MRPLSIYEAVEMLMAKRKPVGWCGEPRRHSEAAKKGRKMRRPVPKKSKDSGWLEGRGSVFDPGKKTVRTISIGDTEYRLSINYEYYKEQRGEKPWRYVVSSNPKGLPGKVTPVKLGFASSNEEAKKEARQAVYDKRTP